MEFARTQTFSDRNLRNCILAHLLDDDLTLTSSVDFHKFVADRGLIITDPFIQQICEFNPGIKIINLENCCKNVTDMGVLAIAQYCHQLEEIKFSDCSRLTKVGVRGLALNCCPSLKHLYFARCSKIDDEALRVIAANVRCLETLVLEGCSQISDCGVSEVATWCRHLRLINLSGCIKIGELGDKSLKVISKWSRELEHLDLTNCMYIPDTAIVFLSAGCRNLTQLILSGCTELTGKSIREAVSSFPKLTVTSLAHCCKINDADLAWLATSCRGLVSLDVSYSPAVSATSLDVLLKYCLNLQDLNISGCPSVDDSMLHVIAKGRTPVLSKLLLKDCHSITEIGVENLVIKSFKLLHLNLSGCQKIRQLFIYRISCHMPFSRVSRTFLGFESKDNATELMQQHDHLILVSASVLLAQRVVRGFLSRNGDVRKRLESKLIESVVPRIQALARRYAEKLRFRDALYLSTAGSSATLIQALWRGYKEWKNVNKALQCNRTSRRSSAAAICVQRIYRGHCSSRQITEKVAAEANRRKMEEGISAASQERAAVVLQRFVRFSFARMLCEGLMRANKTVAERQKFICSRVTYIQHVVRSWRDKRRVCKLRDEQRVRDVHVSKAKILQRAWREAVTRQVRRREDQRQVEVAAQRIQMLWRKVIADRCFVKVEAEREVYHRKKQAAIALLQQMERGRAGKSLARSKRMMRELEVKKSLASCKIQGAARCYLCLDALAVRLALQDTERQMKPLLSKCQTAEIDLQELDRKIDGLSADLSCSEMDVAELERVVLLLNETDVEFWDSDLFSGVPQRFKTSVLRVRLKQILDFRRVEVQKKKNLMNAIMAQKVELQTTRDLMKREISDLNLQAAARRKMERSNRIRNKLRAQRHCV